MLPPHGVWVTEASSTAESVQWCVDGLIEREVLTQQYMYIYIYIYIYSSNSSLETTINSPGAL